MAKGVIRNAPAAERSKEMSYEVRGDLGEKGNVHRLAVGTQRWNGD